MRPKATGRTPPITVLLTPQERWTRAQERWKRQHRRFARRRALLSAAPTLDAIPAAVPYKDLTRAERERRAKTATPGEHALLYPEMHAFRQSMKPKTARGVGLSGAPHSHARRRPAHGRLRARGRLHASEPARRRRVYPRGCRRGLRVLPIRGGARRLGRGAAQFHRSRPGAARVGTRKRAFADKREANKERGD